MNIKKDYRWGFSSTIENQWMINSLYQQLQIAKLGFHNLIFPPFCPICENELKFNERFVCEDCFNQIPMIESPFCRKCGAPMKKSETKCKHCNELNFHFSHLRALGLFMPPLSKMIHFLKYDRKTHLSERLGILLGNILVADPDSNDADIIIPVPLHKVKLRIRGYNQSLLLARSVSSVSHKELCLDAVIRKKATRSQTMLDYESRRKNLENAFEVIVPEKIKNRKIIIVDDVLTTGTTLDEIAKSLLEAGAKDVFGLVLSRAIRV